MKYRKLPNSGLEVSAIGIGCAGFTGNYGPSEEQESLATIQRAFDLGVTFVDTAESYGAGKNEELLAKAIRGRREKLVISSKFGIRPDGVCGRPDYVMSACEGCLKRLGVDVIDLYYQHRIDPEVPVEETVGAMARLVEQGKVRFLGLSEAAPATIRRAQAVHPIAAVQSEYSLLYRLPAEDTLVACREVGAAFVAYSPLGRGLLTGAFGADFRPQEGDLRTRHPRFEPENLARNLELVRQVEEVAREKGTGLPQLVLAWLLAQGDDVIPIPGTRRRANLEINLQAADVELTAADLERLNAIMPPGAAAGERYNEAQIKAMQL